MHTGGRAVGGTRIGGRHVGGLPAVDEPVIERSAVGVDQIRALDVGAGQRPDQLGGKQVAGWPGSVVTRPSRSIRAPP